jgi:hypothetical protein
MTRSTCGTEVDASPAVHDARSVECGDRVCDARGAAIGDVVSRQRHGAKTGASERRDVARISAGRGYIAAQLGYAPGMRDFEVTNRHIRRTQRGRDAREPMVGVGLVEHEVAGKYQIESHAKLVSKFN